VESWAGGGVAGARWVHVGRWMAQRSEHGQPQYAGRWSVVESPNPNQSVGDNGLSSIARVPGGGLWAVGQTTNSDGNRATLILHHQ